MDPRVRDALDDSLVLWSALARVVHEPEALAWLENAGSVPVFHYRVDPDRALAEWQTLAGFHGRTGYWPVIAQIDSCCLHEGGSLDDWPLSPREPADLVAEAKSFDLDGWLRDEKEESYPEEILTGSWRDGEYGNDVPVIPACGYAGLSMVLVPAERRWHIPAYWESCFGEADPVVHLALFRRWEERWDARVVSRSISTVELAVSRRPESRDQCLDLAWEHHCYARDVLYDRSVLHEGRDFQGLEDYADALKRSRYWWLWWD